MDEGRAVDMICLDFSKAFNLVSHTVSLLAGKLAGKIWTGQMNNKIGGKLTKLLSSKSGRS